MAAFTFEEVWWLAKYILILQVNIRFDMPNMYMNDIH